MANNKSKKPDKKIKEIDPSMEAFLTLTLTTKGYTADQIDKILQRLREEVSN